MNVEGELRIASLAMKQAIRATTVVVADRAQVPLSKVGEVATAEQKAMLHVIAAVRRLDERVAALEAAQAERTGD